MKTRNLLLALLMGISGCTHANPSDPIPTPSSTPQPSITASPAPQPSMTISPSPSPSPKPSPSPSPKPSPSPQLTQARFDHVVIIVLENENGLSVLNNLYMANLAKQGSYLSNSYGIGHPSYPNYLAMVSGSTQGITDDAIKNINASSVADLLDKKSLSWVEYAENYPGNCYMGSSSGTYIKRHTPFLSFVNIQKDPPRCAKTINATSFNWDSLPNYAFYVPNLNNDGHDTSIAFSAAWLQKFIAPAFLNNRLARTLVVITYDESGGGTHPIYTLLLGGSVKAGYTSTTKYNHYSVLKMIEDNFQLGDLGLNDKTATSISDVWK